LTDLLIKEVRPTHIKIENTFNSKLIILVLSFILKGHTCMFDIISGSFKEVGVLRVAVDLRQKFQGCQIILFIYKLFLKFNWRRCNFL